MGQPGYYSNPSPTFPGAPSPPGVSVAPRQITPVGLFQLPPPKPPGNTGTPVQWRWAVLLNASPFTLDVYQGQLLGQLAAFTADKYLLPSPPLLEPITVSPKITVASAAPGQDSQVYTTYYEQDPGGQYPAAVGSGAASFAQNSTVGIVSGATGGSVLFGGVPVLTSGFASIRLAAQETSLAGVPGLTFIWYDTDLNELSRRLVQLAPAGSVNLVVPNEGEYVDVIMGGTGALDVEVTLQTFPMMEWNIGPVPGGIFTFARVIGVLIDSDGPQNIGAGFSNQWASLVTYAGPAQLWVNTPAVVGSTVQLLANAADGTARPIGQWQPQGPDFNLNVSVLLPPTPITVKVTNGTGGPHNYTVMLTPDIWRMSL